MSDEKIYVTKSYMPSQEEYMAELSPVWESRWLTNRGQKHNELAEKLTEYLKVPQVQLVVNGHMALELALQALEIKGEVITTPFTFSSTTHAICRSGCIPVFADVNPEDYTLDPVDVERKITDRTVAILPVHVYGNICNVEVFEALGKKYGLKVIYDAAHAFGETYQDAGVASFGDASCFSFHATKVFHTVEGGAICTSSKELADKIDIFKDFGIVDEEVVDMVGPNGKMNEFCAAMGLCNLRHMEEILEGRKRVVEGYRRLLEDVPGIKLSPLQDGVKSNYAYFPIMVDESEYGMNRDALAGKLAEQGIFARKYFYPLTSSLACYQGQFDPMDTPVALKLSKQVLTLPLYPDLTDADVERICKVVGNF